MIHHNTDMPNGTYVYSDEEYDYAIVNGESLTQYFGSRPGEYTSYAIHTLTGAEHILATQEWCAVLLAIDARHAKLYKHHKELQDTIIKHNPVLRSLRRAAR